MATCEMCGSDAKSLIQVKIAGSVMNVCSNCKSLGVTVENNNFDKSHTFRRNIKDDSLGDEVSNNYAQIISQGIQNKNLNLHQLARAVNIKESSLNNYVKGKIKPDVVNARKIGNFLGVDLFGQSSSNNTSSEDYLSKGDDESLSLGDMILKQMKKDN